MPRNEGIHPPCERVDIRYRSGVTVRNIAPSERRWTLNDPQFGVGYAFDIAWWQQADRTA